MKWKHQLFKSLFKSLNDGMYFHMNHAFIQSSAQFALGIFCFYAGGKERCDEVSLYILRRIVGNHFKTFIIHLLMIISTFIDCIIQSLQLTNPVSVPIWVLWDENPYRKAPYSQSKKPYEETCSDTLPSHVSNSQFRIAYLAFVYLL